MENPLCCLRSSHRQSCRQEPLEENTHQTLLFLAYSEVNQGLSPCSPLIHPAVSPERRTSRPPRPLMPPVPQRIQAEAGSYEEPEATKIHQQSRESLRENPLLHWGKDHPLIPQVPPSIRRPLGWLAFPTAPLHFPPQPPSEVPPKQAGVCSWRQGPERWCEPLSQDPGSATGFQLGGVPIQPLVHQPKAGSGICPPGRWDWWGTVEGRGRVTIRWVHFHPAENEQRNVNTVTLWETLHPKPPRNGWINQCCSFWT